MKIRINLIMLLFTIVVFSQGSNKLELPNINPPSPESFMFTEYGKNGINEFTGKLNVGIPIYEYTAGNLKMPITLNYSGAGVKVEDISTWTGINWNLNVGGVISRQIKDGPDEFTSRVIVNESDMKINAQDLCAPNSQFYWGLAKNESFYDTEVDIFNFNFIGYSGSFYLDANFNPVYLENENEIKIQIDGSLGSNQQNFIQNKTFRITTPDGLKYYFGGNQTETTRVLSGAHSIASDGITSFLLYKIEHPVNGTITLEYDNLEPKQQVLSKSYDMSTSIRDAAGSIGRLLYVNNFVERKFVTRIMNPKRLKKIKSLDSNIEVSFLRTDYNANLNFNSVLDSIEVANNQFPNVLLKKINFSYEAKTNPQSASNDYINASRFFLTKVEINKNLKSQGNQFEKYGFEYDDPFGLPDRMSNRRDALGYFNNKNNTSLVPIWKENSYYYFNQPESFANLNPSFEYAKKGSLTKIIYPTSGYSKFEYEPIPAKKKNLTNYFFGISSYDQNELGLPKEILIPGNNLSSDGTVIYTNFPIVYEDQAISFNLELNIADHSGGSTDLAGKGVEFIILDLSTLQETVFTRVFPLLTNPIFTYNLKKGHNYSFKLRFKDGYTSTDFRALESSLAFEVFEGYEIIEGLGVRLKRDTNYHFDNTQTHQKRYYYGTINGGYNDVSKINFLDYNPKRTYIQGPVGPTGNATTGYGLDAIFSSEIVGLGNTIFENPEIFSTVSLSFGGDNFENGGVEKHFLNLTDSYSSVIRIPIINDGCWYGADGFVQCGLPSTEGNMSIIRGNFRTFERSNIGYYKGKLLCERTYVNNDGLFKIKEQQFKYDLFEDSTKKITNFVSRIIFNDMTLTNHCPDINGAAYNSLSSCYFAYYFTKALSFKLMNSKSAEYIEPVPMSSYVNFYDNYNYSLLFFGDHAEVIEGVQLNQDTIEAPFKKINTTQDYEYGILKGLPTKITTVTSDGTTNSILNTYANQANTLIGLTANQNTAYAAMLVQNNVASPIQIQNFQNNTELLSTQRTTYKQDPAAHVIPELIKSSKGSQNLEDRIVFDEYDTKGNPSIISYKDGVKTKYFYNSNNQVIIKIENYTGALNVFADPMGNLDPCDFINLYPTSLVTIYNYDPITNLVINIISPNCKNVFYEYDLFNRLKYIKDHDLNILQRNCYNYKGQAIDCSQIGQITYTSISKNGTYAKNNCVAGGVGSSVIYTVAAGAYTSIISQADADAKAQTDVTTNGQAYANTNGTCTFTSIAKSGSYTKNNCAAGGVGSSVTYTVAAGAYTSIISQADADSKAQGNVTANGQTYANTNGTCTFTSIAKSGSYTRNNCVAGGVGSSVTYTVAAGAYTSIISQADADSKAQGNVTANGQTYANTNGSCTFTSIAKSGTYTKNNCAAGGVGSSVTYTVAAGSFTSTISQADADSKAQGNVTANGQTYANTNGTCTFTSIAKSGTYTKNNCAAGGVGSSVTYTVASGSFTSTISQADADSKAQGNVTTNGQTYANTNGTCTFTSIAKSGSYTRNNCAAGGVGSSVTYTVAAGAYTSTISQADADSKAQGNVTTNGQTYANTNGTCTFTSIAKSGSYTRNNCAAGGVGSSVTYTVASGSFTSTISQADADAKAQANVTANGQTYANTNGTCTFTSIAKSGSYTRNNCAAGGVGSSVTYTVAAGAYTSTISQADADAKAQANVTANGQTYANTNGTCTFTSIAKSGSYTRNNCAAGGVGSSVIYNVAAGAYTSTISQADADSKAQANVTANGQSYANTNGTCTFSSVARSGSFTRNNCASGYTPSSVNFTQATGVVLSIISQADADANGLTKFNNDGQNYANTNATCTPVSFTHDYVFYEDTQDIVINVYSSAPNHNGATFNVRIRFYGTGGLQNLDRSVILPAGQTSAFAGFRTTAFEIYDVQLLSLVQN